MWLLPKKIIPRSRCQTIDFSKANWSLLDEVTNWQQFPFFYELLLARLVDVSTRVEQSSAEFDQLLEQLRNLMEMSDSVPTSKAIPLCPPFGSCSRAQQNEEKAPTHDLFKSIKFMNSRRCDSPGPSMSPADDIPFGRTNNFTESNEVA
jgi:hypothetical protein